MSVDVTIPAPVEAQAKLARFMARLQSEMGRAAPDAVRWAAWYVATSLRASTRKAPKLLRLSRNPGDDDKHTAERFPYFVTRYSRNQPYRSWVGIEDDPAKARRNPRAGLAATSWLWAAEDAGLQVSGGADVRRPSDAAEGHYEGGLNPTVTLIDKLHYIQAAVRHGGKRGVETAMERGATAGLRWLDRKAARATQ